MAKGKSKLGAEAGAKMEKWRLKDPKFQKKTEGGVYFYSSDNPIYGQDIDEKLYNRLPKYIQKSVLSLDQRKTGDGTHAEIYYLDKNGTVQWADEYGVSDFIYSLKSVGKSEYGNVKDFMYEQKLGFKVGQSFRKKRD